MVQRIAHAPVTCSTATKQWASRIRRGEIDRLCTCLKMLRPLQEMRPIIFLRRDDADSALEGIALVPRPQLIMLKSSNNNAVRDVEILAEALNITDR